MKATNLKPGDQITTTNYYTGRATKREVITISKSAHQITLKRDDWDTGKMVLTYHPSLGLYRNGYSNEDFRA